MSGFLDNIVSANTSKAEGTFYGRHLGLQTRTTDGIAPIFCRFSAEGSK
jgi:hypothetical protein